MPVPIQPAQILRRFITKPGFLLARINQIHAALHGETGSRETPAQAEVLLLLGTRELPDQVSLARAVGLDTSTTALVLGNLESGGLVQRQADPADRRRLVLRLTAAGRRRLPAVRQAFDRTQARLIEPLGARDAAALQRLLRHVCANPGSPAPPWLPPPQSGDGADPVTPSPGFLCRRALQVSEAYFLQCTRPLSLTPRQFSALFIARHCPELNQAGFAGIFGLDPATSALIMRNLAGRGLLDRKVSGTDRRARLHSITPAGLGALEAAQPLVDRSERLVLEGCSAAQKAALVLLLQRIVMRHGSRFGFHIN